MKTILAVLTALVLCFSASAATVNGSSKGVLASGVWVESGEGVSLVCVHVTNAELLAKGESSAGCFLTEVQALSKDNAVVSTNVFGVTKWDDHGLIAVTAFYADKNGNETTAKDSTATKFTLRLVVDLDAHTMTKYLETSTNTLDFHLADNRQGQK